MSNPLTSYQKAIRQRAAAMAADYRARAREATAKARLAEWMAKGGLVECKLMPGWTVVPATELMNPASWYRKAKKGTKWP